MTSTYRTLERLNDDGYKLAPAPVSDEFDDVESAHVEAIIVDACSGSQTDEVAVMAREAILNGIGTMSKENEIAACRALKDMDYTELGRIFAEAMVDGVKRYIKTGGM